MSTDQALQGEPLLAEDSQRDLHVPHRSEETFGPWLTAESAARFLDFQGRWAVKNFRKFAVRAGLRCGFRGKRPLYAKADLEAAIGVAHFGRTVRGR